MDQPFTKDELEAAVRVVELINRGGDASIILRGEAHRSYTRKLFAMRDKARKRANSPARIVG